MSGFVRPGGFDDAASRHPKLALRAQTVGPRRKRRSSNRSTGYRVWQGRPFNMREEGNAGFGVEVFVLIGKVRRWMQAVRILRHWRNLRRRRT